MCCCQLASAVAHLLPVLNSSCLCFVAPKQGPDSGPQNGATILKLLAQLPNLWPHFSAHGILRFAFCRECVELQQVASFIHVSCAWCQDAGFTVFSTVWFCSCFRRLQDILFFFFIPFQMPRSREMFSELFTIHGIHSVRGIHLIGHYRWLLRFIAVFFIRWPPNYHLGKFANGCFVWFISISTSVDRRGVWT